MKKGIESQHPLFEQHIERWIKNRDFYLGEDFVKQKGFKYLPRSNEKVQIEQDFKYFAYKQRTPFYEATSRTIEGLIGLATHKGGSFGLSGKLDSHPNNYVDGDQTMESFIQDLIRESLITNRQGILIDFKQSPVGIQYLAEQITNWRFDEQGKLILVVLSECYYDSDPSDPYMQKEMIQYRELRIEDGVYKMYIHRKDRNNQWVVSEPIIPVKANQQPLDFIPFVFLSKAASGEGIEKAPITGLVNSNNHHYNLSADYAHALHYVACPVFTVTGSEKFDVELGGDIAIFLQDPNAKAGYSEIGGAGISHIENGLSRLEDHMATLGSRLLQSRKAGVESAESVRLNQGSETSVLMSVVESVERSLIRMFEIMGLWIGMDNPEISVELNRDFIDIKLSPGEVDSMIRAYQSNAISIDTLLFNLQRGELIPADVDLEEEKQKVGGSNKVNENINLGEE